MSGRRPTLLKDETGKVYGKWTVLYLDEESDVNTRHWVCRCECGTVKSVRGQSLREGKNTQCKACCSKERAAENVKHGALIKGKDRKTFYSYEAMLARCFREDNLNYENYGGRGITVCARWMEDGGKGYLNFHEDMGDRPNKHVLDRIDPNKNYEPDNCRWVTSSESSYNRRRSKNNLSGRTGVTWNKARELWLATIYINYKTIQLGAFDSFEDAVKAREEAEMNYWGYTKE